MKRFTAVAFCLFFLVPLCAEEPTPKPPVAPTKPSHFDFHGKTIDDPYAWIKDKKNPETIKYIEAENAYREAVTKHLQPFAEKLYKEMLSHIKQTDLDVPVRDNGFWYLSKTLVFKCNPEAGHGGASGRYDRLRERAAIYAFVLDQLGIRN